jgi:hypothetical protein
MILCKSQVLLITSAHVLILYCFIRMLQLLYLQVRTHGYWFLRRVSRTQQQQQQQQQQPVSQVTTPIASPAAISAGPVGVVHTGSALSSSYMVTNKPQQQQQQQEQQEQQRCTTEPQHTQQSVADEHDLVTRTDDVLDIAALITALRSGGKRERDADSDSSSGSSSSAGSTSGSSERCAKRRNVYDTAAAIEHKPAAAVGGHSSCSSGSNSRSGSNSNTVGPPKMHYEQSLPVRGYFIQ